uniref:CSC1/OSCA1-like cytosolic domain-containing protein n=1 Tax=Phytophthora ramorum TaxID=164328 RepID=H3H690_PHYRM
MSIDDELDGELAALSSSSSSSDSDSSDSSDSDSDDDGDDPMPDNADKNEVVVATEGAEMGGNKNLREANLSAVSAATSLTRTAPKPSIELGMKKGAAETTEQQTKDSVEKKPVTAVEDAYSPVVTPEFHPPTPEPLRLDASAAPETQSTDNEQSATGVGSQDNDAPEKFPDTSQVKKTGDKGVTSAPDTNAVVDAQPSPSDQTSDLPLCDSVPSSAQPGELETPESDGVSGDTFPEKDSTIGRSRKADEAKLGDSTIIAHKKVKLTEAPVQVENGPGEKVAKARAATDSKTVKKKTAAKVETKEELRMKNSFTAFKQAIVLGQGEEAGNEYARRTIALLVNQSSKFIDTHAAHVTTLCQTLAVAYRKLDVTPMMVHLRGLLVEERHSIGDFLSVSRVQVQVAALQIKVSHDKVFLAHICALHTHLCQSTGQLARSRVLLFELLRDNPNIRGLYFAMGMLEIYPAILEREFDQHCVERQVVLKETLQQVLVAIACVAAERQELLLHQSSITMMHRIADAVQMPELEEVDGGGPSFSRSCVEKLFEKLAASCQPEGQGKHVPVNYFEIAKSLEVCTAVYGLDAITEVLSIERCQELFSHANAEAKSGIIFVVGHIAMAVAPKTSDTQSPRTRSEQYVENVIEWLYHILSAETSDDKTSPDDRFKVLLGCSTVCVELIVEYSALAGLDSRRRVLCAVVKWFDATPSEESPVEVAADSPELQQPDVAGDDEEEQSSPVEAAEDEDSEDEDSEDEDPADEDPEGDQQADTLPEEGVTSDEAVLPEDTADAPSDEGAVEDGLDQEASNQAEAPVSVEQVEVKDAAAEPAVNGDEPHQALDMTSLESTLPAESPRQKAPTSLARAASRLTGSFRQGMTRDERIKSMVGVAEGKARKDRLGEGMKSAFQADMDDIGALGIGMQLYFMLTKYLSVVFLIMGIISLPAIVVNTYGHGITSKMVDPLQLAYSSIGNGGVNSDTAASARSCLPLGDIDCTWETVDTPLTTNPKTVTWIVTSTDVLYSFFFMCFLLFYSYRAKTSIKEHQNKHLTPARYAVLVRGLPKDATEKEILDHFNTRYDLSKEEEYSKLWFGCCWGRRHKVKRSRSKKAVNRNVVSNVDHLEGSTTTNKDLYLQTWIAQVSVAHPTGGLLRTFLSMESLGQKKKEMDELIRTLEAEKSYSPMNFKSADEKLIHASKKKFEKLEDRLEKKRRKIKAIRDVLPEDDTALEKKKMKQSEPMSPSAHDKLAAATKAAKSAAHAAKIAAKTAKTAAANTQQAFDWEACECAFVVFNNLESRRRCLQDYRQSSRWLSRKWQPQVLHFRETIPLIVTTAPEPSNILWENLEVTDRGRFYRQFVTNLITVMLLVISCAIISAAQSTQEQFASKMPPEGLCDRSLPAVYYADTSFSWNAQKRPILWSLDWNETATCSEGTKGETRYHIAYSNEIKNDLNSTRLSYGSAYPDPERCVDPCISETSTDV